MAIMSPRFCGQKFTEDHTQYWYNIYVSNRSKRLLHPIRNIATMLKLSKMFSEATFMRGLS